MLRSERPVIMTAGDFRTPADVRLPEAVVDNFQFARGAASGR
jgi:hypothetical protein